jgi:sodium/proline symporter
LPSLFVGGILAVIFSATISTADSQIIACSAIVTQDMRPSLKTNYAAGKWLTLMVMILALGIALFGPQSVYALVIIGWSAFAAVLGPLVVLSCMGKAPRQGVAVAMMLGAFLTIIFWQQAGLSGAINETLPGIIVAFGLFGLLNKRSTFFK